MAELNITHYRFRLRRRGWARGDAGQRVVKAARQRLPSLIAERLAEIWLGDDADISEPVRLRLRVRLPDLAAACESDEALAALVARLLPRESEAGGDVPESARRRSGEPPSRFAAVVSAVDGAPVRGAGNVSRVLFEWRARGDLAARLESFTEEALEDWHRALLEVGGTTTPHGRPMPPADVETIVRSYLTPPAITRSALLCRRIVAAVEALAQLKPPPDAPVLRRALDALLPLAGGESRSPGDRRSRPSPASSSPSPFHGQGQWPARRIRSALPFLLLRPLERLGYLDALGATFAAANRRAELPVFATALAYKVLAPPARGWRRDPAALAAAAAFAGTPEPISERALSALADVAASLLSPLDGMVARAVLRGHDAARPLLLMGVGGERLLIEVDGLFPIAWRDSLHAALAGCTAPIVIPAAAADTALLAELHTRGVRFVTDAPPTRDERWRRLRHGRPLWSNDAHTADDLLARDAAVALEMEEDAVRLVEALAARRASTLDRGDALDRSVALAAAAALGDIAWTLWRERGPTSPELVLLRFGDLSAQVSLVDGAIEVRLPLGPRRRDLERYGVLGLCRVPWVTDRVLTIAGG